MSQIPVREDRIPRTEGLVCGDQHGSPFVSGADQLEQHAGLGLILCNVGDVVEDEQVKFVEFGDSAFQRKVASGLLKLLDQIGCAGEEHAIAVLDECPPYGGAEMALADPRRPKQQDVVTLSDPAVTGGDGVDMRLGQ